GDARWLILLVLVLLFGPYLPSLSFLPVRIRLDNLLIPLLALGVWLRGGADSLRILPKAGWRYLAFGLWLCASSLLAWGRSVTYPAPATAAAVLAGMDAYLRPLLVLFIACNARVDWNGVRGALRIILLAALPLCLLAYLQLQPWSEQAANRLVFLFYNNGFFRTVEHLLGVLANRGTSVFIQFGTFAMYCVIVLAVSALPLAGGRVIASRWLSGGVAVAAVIGGLLSGSKVFFGAVVILLIGYALMTDMLRRLWKPKVLLCVLALSLITVGVVPRFFSEEKREFAVKAIIDKLNPMEFYRVYIGPRFGTVPGESYSQMGKLWRTGAVDLFLDSPLGGTGFGAINSTTDSFIFALLCMGGGTGLALYLLMLYHLGAGLLTQSRLQRDPSLRALCVSLFLLTLAFGAGSYGFHCLIQDRSGDLFWLLCGLLLGPLAIPCTKGNPTGSPSAGT
ncbi:MAG: hypothetical protein ACYTGH_21845, partial [Planctomycetota bacterium]